jgi:hypothetical protein
MMGNPIVTGKQLAPDLSLLLQGLALLVLLLFTCRIYWPGLTGPFVLDDYWNLNALGAGGGVTGMESLMLVNEHYPPTADLGLLFDKIDKLALLPKRRSDFHFIYSELYVSLGQLDPALIQRAHSFQAYPDAKLIIRRANIAASAGNYSDALTFLERARKTGKDSHLLQPSRLPVIESLEAEYKRRLAAR